MKLCHSEYPAIYWKVQISTEVFLTVQTFSEVLSTLTVSQN